jgi:CheY-like chemotaxis protein
LSVEGVNVRRNSCDVKATGAWLAALDRICFGTLCFIGSTANPPPQPTIMVLILSADAVAAALLGALIETLGYSVRFARPPETTDQTLRRVRPAVCLLDCEDPANCSDEFLGRAAMRGISVVVFGKPDALQHVRALALAHEIDVLMVPSDVAAVDDTLRRAMKKAG